ncbi:MAG: DUF4157 domain-containing protein [Euryarchaeota archaeon]|nr:DUF4157 domain-containing protein [Euryarchaeota archaeon]MBU4139519.1 DUF4157 domain-containing protein [Euryarchaeota archaeon]
MSEAVRASVKATDTKKENQVSQVQKGNFKQPLSSPVEQILFLQRTLGNQAVQKYMKSGALQAKLKIGAPDDFYEQEADRVADAVLRMPQPQVSEVVHSDRTRGIQRQCPRCTKKNAKEEEVIQTKVAAGHTPKVTLDVDNSIRGIRGGGQSLPESVRSFFEPRFGHDFSRVRVHNDVKSSESAQMLNAKAYTLGSDIVFGAGQYAPDTAEGKRLVGHELAHVIQQDRDRNNIIRRYTAAERTTCPCLDWSLIRMNTTARLMQTGGEFTGRVYASAFMRRYLDGISSDAYVNFYDFKSDTGGAAALTSANNDLSNLFLAEADSLPCSGSRSGLTKNVTVPGHFTHGTDLFYAMGGFSLEARGTGSVEKTCDDTGTCTGITATIDIRYRVNDLYDWKADPGGCTPSTGESGCTANTKTVTLPVIGLICDECLNRLAIHGWASEFMVKVRGSASGYTIRGPCGFRNPTTEPNTRDNQRGDA